MTRPKVDIEDTHPEDLDTANETFFAQSIEYASFSYQVPQVAVGLIDAPIGALRKMCFRFGLSSEGARIELIIRFCLHYQSRENILFSDEDRHIIFPVQSKVDVVCEEIVDVELSESLIEIESRIPMLHGISWGPRPSFYSQLFCIYIKIT